MKRLVYCSTIGNKMELQALPHNFIAFVADTQAPMFVETILLKSHRNKIATDLIFKDVIRQHPSAFYLLGDVVNLGYSDRQWRRVDPHLQFIREKGIEVFGILGNHEVMGRPIVGESKFQQRFPEHKRTGYYNIHQNIAIILLNSNFQTISQKEHHQQIKWLEKTLEELDADSNIEFIVVCCHHSPYTNSRIVKPSREVQNFFVPLFLESKKAQLFLSGHAHAFEHFQVKAKDFMVIGGGGGLRQPLRKGLGSLTDLAENYKPMFHYIILSAVGDHLEVRSYNLQKDFNNFEEGLKHQMKKWVEVVKKIG